MGTARDFRQMLTFVTRHAIRPVVDRVFPLAEGNAAIQRMDEGRQFGKVVLENCERVDSVVSTRLGEKITPSPLPSVFQSVSLCPPRCAG